MNFIFWTTQYTKCTDYRSVKRRQQVNMKLYPVL